MIVGTHYRFITIAALLLLSANFLCIHTSDHSFCTPCKQLHNNCKEIPDKIVRLKVCLETEFEKTKKIIDNLELCDQSITISSSTTIATSGVYCVISDITDGPIVIDADNVTLNLNNHSITSSEIAQKVIEVSSGHSNITIRNGIVKVQNAGNSEADPTNGLLVTDCSNLSVQDISFEGNADDQGIPSLMMGARIASTQGIFIDRCSFTGLSLGGLELNACNNGKINCCTARDNSIRGDLVDEVIRRTILLSGCQNMLLETVRADSNDGFAPGGVGFIELRHIAIESSQNCILSHCTANNNNASGPSLQNLFGFFFLGSTDCYCFDCEANDNRPNFSIDGFSIAFNTPPSQNILFDRCRALNNGRHGINVDDGLNFCIKNCLIKENLSNGILLNAQNSYAVGNVVIGNLMIGINRGGGSINTIFFSNYAEGNPLNYSGAIFPITTLTMSSGTFSTPPTAWDNIEALS